MRTKHAWVKAGFAIACLAMPVLGNVWDDDSNDHLWDTAANWNPAAKPGLGNYAEFNDTKVGLSIVSTDSSAWGLVIENTTGAHEMQIAPGATVSVGPNGIRLGYNQGVNLTMNGGGGLQGASGYTTPLRVGHREAFIQNVYTTTVTIANCRLILDRVSEITVGFNGVTGWGGIRSLLDASGASFVSGSASNLVRVPVISIGKNNNAKGTLKLNPAVTNITVDTLEMGNQFGTQSGTLDLGANSQLKTLSVSNNLLLPYAYILCYDGSGTCITGFPGNVAFKMGSSSQRAGTWSIAIGGLVDPTVYSFGPGIKSVEAYITALTVGDNSNTPGHYRHGTLDLRKATINKLDVSGAVKLGGNSGYGKLYLPTGRATCASLDLGVSLVTHYGLWASGLLSLSNTEFVVSGNVTVGMGATDPWSTGKIESLTDGKSSGLDMTNLTATLTLVNAANKIELTFAGPPADPFKPYWGLRMAGNTSSQLTTLNTAGKLTWTMPGLTSEQQAKCGIHYDPVGNVTYVGLPAATKPPGTVVVAR